MSRRIAYLLLYGGTVGVVFGVAKLHASLVAPNPYDLTSSSRFVWTVAWAAVLSVTAYGVGLPDLPRTARSALGTAALGAVVAAVGVSLLQLVAGDALLPRFVVLISSVLLVPWWMLCAAVASGGRSRDEDRDRVVVVADRGEVETLLEELAASPEHAARVVGSLTPEEAAGRGEEQPLLDLAVASGTTVVVLDRVSQADVRVVAQAASLHEAGVRVRTLSLFYEQWLGKLALTELERVSLMFDIGEVHRVRYGRIKRVGDVVLALAGLVPLVALTPVVLVANLLGNRGPLLYTQPRVGKGGSQFRILKFRTMRPHAGPTEWTAQDDDRITPVGRVLRASHLDELPQVLNVLRGDLSVVGPRPEQPHYVEELTAKLPFYQLRHLVRPGLTGWAQVKYHYGADVDDAMEKLQYEFFYLRHQRLAFDLRIVVRTVRTVIGREGR